jgi:hypothetical protein
MSLTAPRATVQVEGRRRLLPVAANATIYQGAQVMLQAGFAAPGAAALNCLGMGMADETVSNAGGAAGAVSIEVKTGVFCFANSAADPVPASQIGANCYIVDDQTVAATNGANTRSVAGEVFNVDSSGVWVRYA